MHTVESIDDDAHIVIAYTYRLRLDPSPSPPPPVTVIYTHIQDSFLRTAALVPAVRRKTLSKPCEWHPSSPRTDPHRRLQLNGAGVYSLVSDGSSLVRVGNELTRRKNRAARWTHHHDGNLNKHGVCEQRALTPHRSSSVRPRARCPESSRLSRLPFRRPRAAPYDEFRIAPHS